MGIRVNAGGQDKPIDVVAVGSWTIFDHLFRVERLPGPGETIKIIGSSENIDEVYWGGCAQNNAAAAARLGASVSLIGVVGQDFRDRGYATYFEGLGVDLGGTIIVEGELSGHSFLFSDPAGESICISNLGIAARQAAFEPDRERLSSARIGIINYQFDPFTLKAAQWLRSAGGRVVISGALITAPEFSELFVQAAHILVCTEYELQQLVGQLGLKKRADLFKRDIQSIVVTQGNKGSLLLSADGQVHIPMIPARQVLDPVGAGDSFVGGLAAGLAFGYPLADAAWLGAAVASFVVEAEGCQTNLPTFQQAGRRVKNNNGPVFSWSAKGE